MQAKHTSFFWALLMALALASLTSPALAEEKQQSKDIVATVNGTVISLKDFDFEVNLVKTRLLNMGRPVTDPQLSEIKKKILEDMINRELLFQESKSKGIKVDEAAVTDQFTKLRKKFPNEDEFKKWLDKMNVSEAVMKSQIKRQMIIRQLVEKEVLAKVTVSDKEIEAYCESHPELLKQPEQVQASHILIKVDANADESKKAEARKKLETIQQRLEKGEDFAALAKEFSECPSSAKGGDLGLFGRKQMVKPFEEAAFVLKPGEVSGIVETRFGYHLIKVVEKKPETTVSCKDVKDKIEPILKKEKIEGAAGLYLNGLKEKAKIETFPAQD